MRRSCLAAQEGAGAVDAVLVVALATARVTESRRAIVVVLRGIVMVKTGAISQPDYNWRYPGDPEVGRAYVISSGQHPDDLLNMYLGKCLEVEKR